ncbi:hypothetical protein PR048_001112 [Dryococelus australis]|uniref:Integrase catalytic domain-containing protein n=1 Tax=Dryococelus australis TaxID=614101 RepID=A0ABQ9IGF3_9NEOP|nr:hypothetical protein PR048_001112 [Dryococelus australis]
MKQLARCYVWWPGLDSDIEQCVGSCLFHDIIGHVYGINSGVGQKVGGNVYSLTVWYHFKDKFFYHSGYILKWLEIIPTCSMTTAVVVELLRNLFATHGLPENIMSDNGINFTSQEFHDFLR